MTRYRMIFVYLLSAALVASAAAAAPHELWVVSTRSAPVCGAAVEQAELGYQRFDADGGWMDSDEAAFLAASSAQVPTSFYIHGNRMGACEAIREGRGVWRLLSEASPDRPLRVVIWSWPASQIRGRIRNDVQIKAARSDVQAYYLARLVDRMPAGVPLSMMGHSFGARVITGALHLLGGGGLAGRALDARKDRPRRGVRVVLVAAALDSGSLLPGRRNGLALGQVEQMLITQNSCDRVLRWYPRMYGRRGPEALGFTGPACRSWLGEDLGKLEVLPTSCSVGYGHGWAEYLCSMSLRGRLPWYAFLESPKVSPSGVSE